MSKSSLKLINGNEISLNTFEGKVVLYVNIATRCGFTPQLTSLEKLYDQFKDKGFLVIGVPTNDFGKQTPESNDEVNKICSMDYGVNFPITEKVSVLGEGKHPFFQSILAGLEDSHEVKWNFEKFLVDQRGQVVQRFDSKVEPTSSDIVSSISKLLEK
ncbi:MAG: redoxin domain-containing protein [Bdellovibrionales bacterium]|nr:redoxin domain-containing protein [Bdellovibrionales bacterium]